MDRISERRPESLRAAEFGLARGWVLADLHSQEIRGGYRLKNQTGSSLAGNERSNQGAAQVTYSIMDSVRRILGLKVALPTNSDRMKTIRMQKADDMLSSAIMDLRETIAKAREQKEKDDSC